LGPSFRFLFVVLFVHKSLDRCASIFGLALGVALEFFRRRQPSAECNRCRL
jgi:hypothetical protein